MTTKAEQDVTVGETLWALLVPGPDDLWPMPSREAADALAERHNAIVDDDDWPYPELRASAYATVVVWPFGTKAHTEMMDSGDSMVMSRNDAGVPDRVASTMGLPAAHE